jgi:hypothetical protein
MSPTTKLALYAGLVVCLGFFGCKFYSEFTQMPSRQAKGSEDQHASVPPEPTNSLGSSNTVTASNVASTAAVISATGTSAPVVVRRAAPPSLPAEPTAPRYHAGRMMGFVGLFVVSAVLFGVMVARDVSHLIGHRTHEYVLTDEHVGSKPAEYEQAEGLWANGSFLEAVQMLRDLLKRNPSDLFIAQRIAEIYENDLHNHLAAALEYEEILKHKFDPERWGWMAIHLANLYSGKLNQRDKAVEWLQRIDAECAPTAAAKKARERLGKPESGTEEPTEAGAKDAPEAEGSFKLPPGFRPKES